MIQLTEMIIIHMIQLQVILHRFFWFTCDWFDCKRLKWFVLWMSWYFYSTRPLCFLNQISTYILFPSKSNYCYLKIFASHTFNRGHGPLSTPSNYIFKRSCQIMFQSILWMIPRSRLLKEIKLFFLKIQIFFFINVKRTIDGTYVQDWW